MKLRLENLGFRYFLLAEQKFSQPIRRVSNVGGNYERSATILWAEAITVFRRGLHSHRAYDRFGLARTALLSDCTAIKHNPEVAKHHRDTNEHGAA